MEQHIVRTGTMMFPGAGVKALKSGVPFNVISIKGDYRNLHLHLPDGINQQEAIAELSKLGLYPSKITGQPRNIRLAVNAVKNNGAVKIKDFHAIKTTVQLRDVRLQFLKDGKMPDPIQALISAKQKPARRRKAKAN